MDIIKLNAYAKINLFLEVCEKRPDSYHNIDSVMQSVTLCDIVTVKKANSITLSNTANLPNDSSNLAYKAAMIFFEYTGINSGADIHIEKHIPISAGLAGGSTDAAAVLKALNELYATDIDIDTLCALGSKLGADVPFCIKGGTYLTKGIGDEFTECNSLPECWIVISKKGDGISTPYAYGEIDKLREKNDTLFKTSTSIISALQKNNIEEVCKNTFNIFENIVCQIRPLVNEQKMILDKHNAVCSMMSGSGPSVFGIFLTKKDAESALTKLIEYGSQAYICKPI